MRKYLTYFSCVISAQTIFKFFFFIEFFSQVITMLVKIFLWKSIVTNSPGYFQSELSTIVTYFLIAFIISQMTEHRLEIADKIRQGTLSADIVKPVSIMNLEIARAAAIKAVSLVKLIPVTFVLYIVFFTNIELPPLHAQALIFVLLSFLLYFNIQMLIHNLSFWLIDITALTYILSVIFSVLSGNMIPFDFLPPSVRNVLELLPFQFFIHVPVNALLGNIGVEQYSLYFIQACVYLLLFTVINQILFRLGIKRYVAVGG